MNLYDIIHTACITIAVIVATIVVGYIAHYAIDTRQAAVHQEKIICMEKADSDLMLSVCNGVRS